MGFRDWLNTVVDVGINTDGKPLPVTRGTTGLMLPPRSASAGVNMTDALSLAGVFRAVSILSTAIKQLSVHLYRDGVELASTPLWVRQPDPNMSRASFLDITTTSMALSGNAFYRIYRNARNETIKLEVLNPYDVLINSDDWGNLTGYTYRGVMPMAIDEIYHLRLFTVPGNLYGVGPIQMAQKELLAITSTRDYVSEWFQNGGAPSGVLTTQQFITKEQAQEAADDWNNRGSGKTAVLGSGLTFASTYLSPKDAQFLETQSFGVEQIARMWGVPINLMQSSLSGGSMTYSNIEQELISFTRFTLAAYYVEIEEAFTALLPRGTDAKMNVDALLRSDTLSRYQAHSIALDPAKGWLTQSEVRKIENLDPAGGPVAN